MMGTDFFKELDAGIIKGIIENLPTGIYINDMKGVFLYGNRRAEKIVGYKREELVGKNMTEVLLLDVKGVAKALKLLALNRLGKETGPDEFKLNRKDGGKSIVIIRTTPVTIGNRKVVIGMVEDITERKELEDKLKERNEELEKIHRFSVGREVKMTKLKREIRDLKARIDELKNK
jgi:PAS domain S-box-containing protein